MNSRVASPRTQDTSDIGYHPDINRFVNKDTETDTSQYTQNCPTATRSRVNDYRCPRRHAARLHSKCKNRLRPSLPSYT
jgi:hypothetical protein